MRLTVAALLTVSLFLSPNVTASAAEFNYGWGHPTPLGNPVFEIEFLDAQTGWAIGGGGEVLRSDDGGENWTTLLQPGEMGALLHDFLILDATTLIAVGTGAGIYRSTDGGQSWSPVTNAAPGWLRDLARIPGGGISAIGDGGALLISDDGGLNWSVKGPGLGSARHHLWQSASEVYVVGEDLAHRSIDGGDSWTLLFPPAGFGMNTVFFIDPLNGWIADDFGYWRTTDGGDSWTNGFDWPPYAFRMLTLSPTHWLVICFLEGGELWETTDAGANWSPLDFRSILGYLCIHQAPGGRIFIGSDVGDLLYSDDLGQSLANGTENLADGSLNADILCIHATPGGTLYASNQPTIGNDPGTWLRSDDGGQSWHEPAGSPGLKWAEPISFHDEMHGLTADDEEVRYTLDGGATWLESVIPGTERVNGLATPAPDRYFAAAWSVAGGGHLWRSTDSGQTWTVVAGGIQAGVAGKLVQFLNPDTGFFLGSLGTTRRVYRSDDGGDSWSLLPSTGLPAIVSDMFWSDTQIGLASVFSSGSEGIYRTTDGGVSWTIVSESRAEKVRFGSDGLAFAIGPYFDPPQLSEDNGLTWGEFSAPLPLGFPGHLSNVTAIEPHDSGWILGGQLNRILVAGRSVTEVAGAAPQMTAILPTAHPNPFNPSTRIQFTTTVAGNTRVALHDVRGRLLRVLHAGTLAAGDHEFAWDGLDREGRKLPSGIYLAKVHGTVGTGKTKLVLLK